MFTEEETRGAIVSVCEALKALVLEKNRLYGNSAIEPERIFSRADPLEQLNVRMDDKLSRIRSGQADDEDPEWDLAGYLVLKAAAKRLYGERQKT
jgi:hypothetical protein